jgi:hypothetical protein
MTESNPETTARHSQQAATMTEEPTAQPADTGPDDEDGRLSTSDLVARGEQANQTTDRADEPEDSGPPLVNDADSYMVRWQAVQAAFVDEPKGAVQDADALVAEVIQRLAESFATERDRLEQQWSGGQTADTEELRVALQRYRSFFNRLLTT